ncbi:hypothetical protein PVAND_007820 [Polypedilum vanderplanki]|uniref:Phosphatidylinositol 4-kinase beta n=1 Tax=Polypedilum vanderplanki TaxID=319348 RepID=A0A9J6C7S6_POLVA|nr:hypothetical protein PVAND_007820 [Polypedilum vanderplanki]
MNSVFSAFKSNKSSNNVPTTTTLNSTASSDTNKKYNSASNKKTLNLNETNNYEKLRHIREKMSNLMIDDDEINLRKPSIPPISPINLNGEDECDSMLPPKKPILTQSNSSTTLKMNGFDSIDSVPLMKLNGDGYANGSTINSLSSIKKHYNQDNSENYASENNLLSKCCNGGAAAMGSDVSIADVNDVNNSSASATSLTSIKSMPLSNSNELACRSALTIYNKQPQPTNFSNSNRNRPRLSLSSVNSQNGSNSANQPAVHGRNSSNGLPTGQTRTRLSTHQRNLSLDFRSMGILLPPVSQVVQSSSNRINMTQHHRNRSLDSALQRIPEVEVSSPNAESENTLCTNSVLSQTTCNATSANEMNNIKITQRPSSASTADRSTNDINKKCINDSDDTPPREEIDTATTTKSMTKTTASTDESSQMNISNKITRKQKQNSVVTVNKDSESKKREDLTSLGSDDSGIICGSDEADQQSLNNRRSHESLDSGETEQSEEGDGEGEECVEELVETTSMDEDYRELQSDLCFYQTKKQEKKENMTSMDEQLDAISDKKIRYRELNMNKVAILKEKYHQTICVPIEFEEEENVTSVNENDVKEESKDIIKDNPVAAVTVKDPKDPMFKSFFFKNAIFRTAQSIIENHEKKNANKNKDQANTTSPSSSSPSTLTATGAQQQSPSCEVPNKREFLFKSRSKNQSTTLTTSASAEITTATTPVDKSSKGMSKSSSTNSLNTMKVPGTACMLIRESVQPQIKTERGQSGLLRFFESPVFNIHFAIHYLFYSKEPGVLSFIGNKIFSFPHSEVDLYIPQLILMYMQIEELAEVLDPYLVYRCRQSADFSLKCSWLLEAYNFNVDGINSTTHKFRHLSLMRELYPKRDKKNRQNPLLSPTSPFKKTHHRSQSDATGMLEQFKKPLMPTLKLCLGDLSSGRAFDNGCVCFESQRGTVNDLLGQQTVCSCGAPKLASEKEFMKSLIDIGKTLTSLPTKIEKTSRLRVLLNLINKNLPARVWLPLYSDIPHHVVRITEDKTAVLNSKDKTPYIIYVEVVEVADIYTSPVIPKMMPTLRHTKSDEHLDLLAESDERVENKEATTIATNPVTSTLSQTRPKDFTLPRISSNLDVFNDDEVWSQEDDEITAQYLKMSQHKRIERDAVSQFSMESFDSTTRDINAPQLFNIADVRFRHCRNLNAENTKPFKNDPDDPSAAALKEPWDVKERQIRESSPYGHLQNWKLLSAIVKSGDDLRQELMAVQLLETFNLIWTEENIDLFVRPYEIVCLSNDSGLIEPILNTVSLHQIKKNSNKSLREYFIDEYGGEMSENFQRAQRNFMQSCAAYSLICYLLQVKDRHNGNILLHSDGHIIHIDFGFILSISPKNLGFEQSPFKLTPEFVEVMSGPESELFAEFRKLLIAGLKAARKHQDRLVNIVEIMRSSTQLPCFKNGCLATVQNLRKRFHMNHTEQELERKVDQLIQDSLNSLSTKLYDGYQYLTNGIL